MLGIEKTGSVKIDYMIGESGGIRLICRKRKISIIGPRTIT